MNRVVLRQSIEIRSNIKSADLVVDNEGAYLQFLGQFNAMSDKSGRVDWWDAYSVR